VTGHHTLGETELAVQSRVGSVPLDFEAMSAISNIYRASTAIRNHLERSVLHENDLTWTAFVVLWVVWIWDGPETRHVAEEVGISKGTLTGVLKTLEARGLLERHDHPDDGRLVLTRLTAEGEILMTRLFPVFNAEEAFVAKPLTSKQRTGMAESLRAILTHLEAGGVDRQADIRADAQAARPRRSNRSSRSR
jgi:MarR family transcriptional regulator, organic hydroperoxide resistance regulator